ncbi:MAG: response regulator [Deltaproteobacteria bacterium]|nr:response regulator [Deltaproteobacteria bacterium]
MEYIRVLLVEGNPTDSSALQDMLRACPGVEWHIERLATLAQCLARLDAQEFDVLLLDLDLPDGRGLNALTKVQARAPAAPIVVLLGEDDFELSVRAVRTGAQDGLVKAHLDGRQLLRAIRHAIARRAGGHRPVSVAELALHDGKEGRPAWLAVRGIVYDVTGSRMWRNGVHVRKHAAGTDLGDGLGAAPHGEDVLARFPVVGELVPERTKAQRIVALLERLHLHPISVHFPQACSILAAVFATAFAAGGDRSFDTTSWHLLLAAFAATPAAIATGLFDWRVTYQANRTPVFVAKIALSSVLALLVSACFAWRLLDPDVLAARTPASWMYLALLLALVPAAVALGRLGGRIVFPE